MNSERDGMNFSPGNPSAGNTSAGSGMDDAQLSSLLVSLPRDQASDGFTDAVLERVSSQETARTVDEPVNLAGVVAKMADLLFGSRRSYWSLLAASAAVALAVGLGWSSDNSTGMTDDARPTTVAEAGDSSSTSTSSGAATPFRGQPVTTASRASRPDAPRVRLQPINQGLSPRALEIQGLREDYARLQRELLILRQLAAEGSPMIELGSNGEVDLYIDLGEFVQSSSSAPGSSTRADRTGNVQEQL